MKNLKLVAIATFAMLTITSCKQEGEEPQSQCRNVKWSYTGEGKEWADLCDVGGLNECGYEAQSPINIEGAVVNNELKPIELNYKLSKAKFYNTGHGVKFDLSGQGNTAMIQGEEYNLLQFHYHAKSEHTIDSKYSPIEVHFVHQNKNDENKLAVIGAMIVEGASNDLFASYLDQFPSEEDTTTKTEIKDLNVADLLPSVEQYYNYSGSLTTPPCSEVVNWHVLKAYLTASKEQIEKFSKLLNGNYRPLQERNGRVLSFYQGN